MASGSYNICKNWLESNTEVEDTVEFVTREREGGCAESTILVWATVENIFGIERWDDLEFWLVWWDLSMIVSKGTLKVNYLKIIFPQRSWNRLKLNWFTAHKDNTLLKILQS